MDQSAIASFFHSVTYVVTNLGQATQQFSALVPGCVFLTGRMKMELFGTARSDAANAEPVKLECATGTVGPRGEYEIRLIQPLGRDSLFYRSLTTSGPGLHHVGFRVPDLDSAVRKLVAGGPSPIELRDEDGRRHSFCRCEPIGGLIELSEMQVQPTRPVAIGGKSLASYFTQIAYVVNDISAARRWMEEVLGCEVATARDVVQGPSWNLRFRGQPAANDFWLKMAIGKLGPTGEGQIELIEPQRNNNVLADFLNEHGPGLNHIAFVVPDYENLTRPLRSTGVPPLKEIHVPGMVHSSYFDCTRKELSTMEVFETGPHT